MSYDERRYTGWRGIYIYTHIVMQIAPDTLETLLHVVVFVGVSTPVTMLHAAPLE